MSLCAPVPIRDPNTCPRHITWIGRYRSYTVNRHQPKNHRFLHEVWPLPRNDERL